jgi:hypothetical protein
MADEEVAQINENASQLLSESQPAPAEPVAEAPSADPAPEPAPVPAPIEPAAPTEAPAVEEQPPATAPEKEAPPATVEAAPAPAPAPEIEVAPATECEAPKVQVQPDAPMFKPIIASPIPQHVTASPVLTNGFTNGYTNGFNGDSAPTPVPISNELQITLNKEEGQSWGFRLNGGKEFGLPLTVSRVRKISQIHKFINLINDCFRPNLEDWQKNMESKLGMWS